MRSFGPRGMHVTEKSKRGIVGILRELFSYSSKLILPVAVALLFAVIGAVLTIIGPNLLSRITDLISDSLFSEIDLGAIASIGILLLILYGLSAIFTYIEHYIMSTVTLGLSRDMRRDLSHKINRVPMKYFNTVDRKSVV